jgi:hypothetical protein
VVAAVSTGTGTAVATVGFSAAMTGRPTATAIEAVGIGTGTGVETAGSSGVMTAAASSDAMSVRASGTAIVTAAGKGTRPPARL